MISYVHNQQCHKYRSRKPCNQTWRLRPMARLPTRKTTSPVQWCVCNGVCVFMHVCVCVCVWERERERVFVVTHCSSTHWRHSFTCAVVCAYVCVCTCVYVCVRERDLWPMAHLPNGGKIICAWCICMYVYMCVYVCLCVWGLPIAYQLTGTIISPVHGVCACVCVCMCVCVGGLWPKLNLPTGKTVSHVRSSGFVQ